MSQPAVGLHELFRLPDQPVELPDGVPAEAALPVLTAALAASPQPCMMTDADLHPPGPRIVFVNPAFCDMTGYAAAELVGRSPRLLQGPATDRRVLDELKAAVAAGQVFRGQTVNYTKAGHEYPVCWTIVPVRHGGRAVRYLSYQHRPAGGGGGFLDPFELIYQTAPAGIAVTDAAGRFVRVNPAYQRLTGYADAELVGRPLTAVVPPAEAEAAQAMHDRFMASGGEYQGEYAVVRRGGDRRAVLMSGGRLTAANGHRYAVWTLSDLTELRGMERRLRAADERFDLTLTQCGLAVWDWDAATDRVYYSPGWKAMLGHAEDEVGDTAAEAFDRMHPDDRPAVAAAWAGFLAGTLRAYDLEFRLRHKDGSWRWVQSRGGALRGPDGRAYRVAGTHTDRTAEKLAEAEFRQAQKMDAVGRLAGGIAHDFNNLLTIIIGNLDLMALAPDDPDRHLADAARTAAGRAAELTTQLLGFSRRLPVRFGPVDAGRLLADTADLLRRLIDPRIALRVDRPADRLFAHGDTGLLQQAVLNLCVNARDAMPAGGTLTLSADAVELTAGQTAGVRDARPGRFVRLAVADTGTGMPAEVQAHLFEPFFTTKPVGRGTGLGLAMVYGTVRQHDGWVRAVSAEGTGTVMEVYLPPAAGPADAPEPAATAPPPAAAGPRRVLVVDDEDAVRLLARMVLERAGWEVADAPSAEAGLAVLAADPPPDAIVLDLTMPGLSGAEAVRRVRAAAPGVHLVIASGYEPPDELRDVPAMYLPKPYRPDALVRAVGG